MQSKILLVLGAILAPLVAAAPTANTEDSAVLKDRELEMDPLFKVMAWKEGLDEILKEAMRNKAEDHGSNSHNNGGWSHPIWPYDK